jgi:hypothetical protein
MKTQKTSVTLKNLRKEFGKVREESVRRENQNRQVRTVEWQKAVKGLSYTFKLV